MNLGKKTIYMLAIVTLALMLRALLSAAAGDSVTTDEVPHIAAGYSYVAFRDYRLNPEHPPLVKALAGLSISTLNPVYPTEKFYVPKADQYVNGYKFLFERGNDADAILFRGRLPVVMITGLLGALVFLWSRELNGLGAALFSLVLLAFDPNLIGHGHLVTQDAALAAAVVASLYLFWKYIQQPRMSLLVASGVVFGLALLTKFSSPLLLPVFVAMIAYSAFKRPVAFIGSFARGAAALVVVSLIATGIVFAGYGILMRSMPDTLQDSLITSRISGDAPIVGAIAKSGFRPLAQYLLGFVMVKNHVSIGHKTFFVGSVTTGTKLYYPLTFAVKSTLPALALILFSIAFGRRLKSSSKEGEFALLAAAVVFAIAAMVGNLDLGIRYLLPIYPLLYIYGGKFVKLIHLDALGVPFGGPRFDLKKSVIGLSVGLLAVWQVATSISISPYYLSYFNEVVGPVRGGELITDSNIDWGQDMKRLAAYVEAKGIDRIHIDYFGGSLPGYYLKNKAVIWRSRNIGRPKGWFAVSINNLTRGRVVGHYAWLDQYEPEDRIGYSILVYKLP